MGFRLRSRRSTIVAILALIGLVNCWVMLRPLGGEDIAPLPITAAIAPSSAATPVGLRAYVSLAKTRATGGDQRERTNAAIMFLSYFLVSTRGLGEVCEQAGVDLSAAKAQFAASHRQEYDLAATHLARQGLDSNILWTLFNANLVSLSVAHAEQYDLRFGTDRHGTCERLNADPAVFAAMRNFRSNYPTLHATLTR